MTSSVIYIYNVLGFLNCICTFPSSVYFVKSQSCLWNESVSFRNHVTSLSKLNNHKTTLLQQIQCSHSADRLRTQCGLLNYPFVVHWLHIGISAWWSSTVPGLVPGHCNALKDFRFMNHFTVGVEPGLCCSRVSLFPLSMLDLDADQTIFMKTLMCK